MTMRELAIEYRESGEMLRGRIDELKSKLSSEKLCETEKFRLRTRIEALRSLFREVNEVAVFMEKYYEEGYRKNGRYSV